ncbi:hypothetical protein PROFUN_14191, partial [Planoprotostelium fungivorum]
ELSNVKSQSAKRCTGESISPLFHTSHAPQENGMWKAKHEVAERTITDLRPAAVVAELQSLSLTDGPRFPICTKQHQSPSAPVVDTSVSIPVQADMEAEVTNTAVSTPTQAEDTADMEDEVIDTSSDMKSAPIDTDSSSEIDMDAEDTDTSIVMDCEQEDTSTDYGFNMQGFQRHNAM